VKAAHWYQHEQVAVVRAAAGLNDGMVNDIQSTRRYEVQYVGWRQGRWQER
jgi:hypothetical protein